MVLHARKDGAERYFSAAELVESLYRGLADNSVGRVIESAIGSHWPFEDWSRFLPNETTAVSLLDGLRHHGIVVVTDGPSFCMREARKKGGSLKTA